MKRFFRRKLRKSQSVHEDDRKKESKEMNGGAHITSSCTFDVAHANSSQVRSSTMDDDASYMDATSSSVGTEEHRFDSELDRHMMQTINDVKFVNRRPKFTAVGEVNFQRQCLDAHNALRARYGAPSVMWSQELADLAHTWAMKLADRGRILYPELPGIGENIKLAVAEHSDHLTTGAEIVDEWSVEAQKFNFDKPTWNPNTQHFTQMVWRDTYEMGVSRYWNTAKNCVAIVAFYRSPGNSNAPGEFQANVPSKLALDADHHHHHHHHEGATTTGTPVRCLISAMKRSTTISD
uniref:SCP domain-containing protein n=1 Tax=Steinernema glaseri TaxID=37863 RepID=A0A1I7ZV91_9BILA